MDQSQPQPAPPLSRKSAQSRWIDALTGLMNPRCLVELFILANLAFLGLDIFVAHAVNRFAHRAEWIPLGFSAVAVIVLLLAIAIGGLHPTRGIARWLGLVVGWCSIFVGVAGLIFHLNSQFFEQFTLKSLVYTAPFAAPLAYAGLGLLLILNRIIAGESRQWAAWVIVMTWGGFIGNFFLSLADHAENGFFVRTEWIAVAASALAVGFLLMPVILNVSQTYLRLCYAVMGLEIVVGLLGFCYHVRADLHGPSSRLVENFLFGAPAFAPLLFANLAALGAIGIWSMERSARATQTPSGNERKNAPD